MDEFERVHHPKAIEQTQLDLVDWLRVNRLAFLQVKLSGVLIAYDIKAAGNADLWAASECCTNPIEGVFDE